MRHRVKGRRLNRTASHRLATMRALATALFLHKKIKTTVAKAKSARLFIEPLITKAKKGTVHAHRLVARHINDREAMQELFGTIIDKIADRPGGYTRVVKLGQRHGDGAEMAILELVDFGEVSSKKKKSKPSTKSEKAPVETAVTEDNIEDAEIVEETVTEENTVEAEQIEAEDSLTGESTESKEDAVEKSEVKEEEAKVKDTSAEKEEEK